jgi:hypothetical protein
VPRHRACHEQQRNNRNEEPDYQPTHQHNYPEEYQTAAPT